MGWKSTIDITRKEAISAIMNAMDKTPFDDMTDDELKDEMYGLGIGDDVNLPYHGYNFCIVTEEEKEELNKSN